MFKTIRQNTKTIVWLIIFAFIIWGGSSLLVSQHRSTSYVGEIGGKKITYKEHDDISKMLDIFTPPTSGAPRATQVWYYLVLKKEAEKRKLTVSDERVKTEIQQLFSKDQGFNQVAYENWVRNVLRESPRGFEELVRQFLIIQQLMGDAMREPGTATDEEAKAKFLAESNTIEADVIEFPTEQEAKDWLAAHPDEKSWEDEKKKTPSKIMPIGVLSVDQISRILNVSEAEAMRIHAHEKGQAAGPIKTARGFLLLRINDKKTASEADWKPEKLEEYKGKVIQDKAQKKFQEWSADLVTKAGIKQYQ